MLYDRLIPDIWCCDSHRHISYLTLISHTGTCHATLITWYLTPVLTVLYLTVDMLSPGTSIFDLILWHLTGYYYTGHLYFFAYSWLSLLWGLEYYIVTRHLVLLNSCTPELLYSWNPEKGWLRYYTPVDPRNKITMNIALLWTPCGHYHWTNSIIRQLTPGWGKLMSTDIVSMFMMVL